MSIFVSFLIYMTQVMFQDLAALDAMEANHYAAKQTQSATVSAPASGVPATSRPMGDLADQQQQLHAKLQHEHQRKATDTQTADRPSRQHLHTVSTVPQTDRFGPAKPPLTHGMQPAVQASAWPQQQQQVQHAPSRQAPRQSSMQSFMAVHANHRASAHPNLPATAIAAPSLSSAQQQVKAAHATGMLVYDVDDCIDLIGEPEPQNPSVALQAGQICDPALSTDCFQPAQAGTASHDQTEKGTEKEALDDIVDDHPEDKLMECSTNLLNPGIRVHKYSFGLPPHAVTCTTVLCMMRLSLHCSLSLIQTLRLTAVHQNEHQVNTMACICICHVLMPGSVTISCLQSTTLLQEQCQALGVPSYSE